MFKLKKILNAKTNVPEYLTVEAQKDIAYEKGCAIVLADGKPMGAKNGEIPTHICAAVCADKSPAELIIYKITSEMIFEATIAEECELSGDEKFGIFEKDGTALCLTREVDGAAELWDMPDTDKSKTITVRFNI